MSTDYAKPAHDDPPMVDPHGDPAANGHRPFRGTFAGRLKTRADLRNLPKPEPLITDTLDTRTTALIVGQWGTCKSFVALDWCLSLATGAPWLGRPTMQRRVLYVLTEGAYGLDERVAAWESAWRRSADGDQFIALDLPVNLGSAADVTELAGILAEGGYGFVVFDTLAKCMVGLDENSSRDAGLVLSNWGRLVEVMAPQAGTVAGVHHTGKDGKTYRGSSALAAGVDTMYFTEGTPDALTLYREKRKDGPKDDSLTLRLAQVPGTGSAVLEVAAETLRHSESTESLLSHFRSHFSETGASPTMVLASIPEGAAGLSRPSVYRGLNALVRDGVLDNTGTGQRPYYTLTGVTR